MDVQPIKPSWRKHRKATIVVVSGLLYAGGWSIVHLAGLGTTGALILILGAIVGGYDIAKRHITRSGVGHWASRRS